MEHRVCEHSVTVLYNWILIAVLNLTTIRYTSLWILEATSWVLLAVAMVGIAVTTWGLRLSTPPSSNDPA